MDDLGRRLGVHPVQGGKHRGRGTHNALLGLAGGAYLEIIAFDPEDPAPKRAPLFRLDAFALPRLVSFAVGVKDIDVVVERARRAGYDPGQAESMSRLRSDGTLLRWRLTPPPSADDFVIPFLIDWGDTPHPSQTSPEGVRLIELQAEHPEPEAIARALAALGVNMAVRAAREPALVATLDSSAGRIILR